MPNHVINEIVLHGVTLEACKKHLYAHYNAPFSFSVLLPLPLNFWPGSVGQDAEVVKIRKDAADE